MSRYETLLKHARNTLAAYEANKELQSYEKRKALEALEKRKREEFSKRINDIIDRAINENDVSRETTLASL